MWFEQSYTGRGHYCGDPISALPQRKVWNPVSTH